MAYGFQGLKSLGLEGEQMQNPPMSLPVKQPEYDPSGYASFAKPSVSDAKGEIKQSPKDIVTAKYGYTPGQMPGINKDIAGVQGTSFNNWDDTTKQSIRKSIAETPVVKRPSVKEAVKKAGYNPQESLGDLVETAKSNGGALSDEQIAQYFPEFKGKERVIGDYFATLNAKPDLTPEETQQYFPEFFETVQSEVSAGGKFGQLAQDKGEWNDNLLPTLQTTNEATTTSGVLKEFGMNILKSGINLGSAVGNMVLNPVDSAKTIGKLGIGTLQNIYEAATGDEQDGEYAQLASQVGQYFKDRYGSEEGFQKAAYEDPVGVFSDLASIVSGGASVVAKTVGTAGKVANVAGATKAATALGKVAQGASKVAKIADTIDPATQIMKATGNVVSASAKTGGKVMKGAAKIPQKTYEATRKIVEGANEAYARKVTGLSQKAVDTFKSNPTRRNVESGQLTEDGLMKEVADTVASEKSRLDETGKAYEAVRNKDTIVKVGTQLPDITEKLSKYNISVAPDGKLNFADSALESDVAGQKAIQFAYDVAKRGEIPADIFLNKRLDISNSIDWRSGVSDTANKITKEIRNSLNEAGHRDVAGLGALDETYGPQRKVWNQIAREFIDRETGGLKDSAKSKIMNMTNANKEALLAKIEQYFPDISLKVDALRTAREVDSLKGIKAGTYNKTALVAGGAKAGYELGQKIIPGGGLIGAPLGAIAGFIATDPAYIIKRLKGLEAKVPEEIMKKIELKQNLAKKEAGLVQKAISDAAKQSADRQGLESKFKSYMEGQGKEKPLALPEKSQGYNLGTKKNPIVAKAPEGYVAKPMKDLSTMEKIAATPQDAPKKGYETKLGKVTEITNNGGANPTYRVKVEGSDKRHNIDEIGGVYKPKTEAKMPRQEKTQPAKQEPEGLKVAPGGKKEYYLKLIKEEYGLDINKMDTADMLKVKDAINSRTPAKAEEIMQGLQRKYSGKKYKREDDIILYRAGGLDDVRKTGIFFSNDRDVAKSYETTGLGGKTTKEYRVSPDAKLYDAVNRRDLMEELDSTFRRKQGDLEYGFIKKSQKNKGEGPTGSQMMQTYVEKKIKQELQKRGYDGVRYSGGATDQKGEYQIFDSKYIITKESSLPEKRFKREGDMGKLTINEAKAYIQKYFKEGEVSAKFVEGMTTPEGRTALGAYADGLIEFTKNPTKELLDHEALHAYIDKFTDTTRRDAVYKAAQEKHALEIGGIQKKYGISKAEATEEWIADGFAEYVAGKRTFTGKVASYFKMLWNDIKTVFGKGDAVKSLYKDLETGKRTTGLKTKAGDVKYKAEGMPDKYTMQPILDIRKEIKGDIVKKQTLLDMMNRQSYKGPEKQALQRVIDSMSSDSMIKEIAVDQLKQEIMPLKGDKTERYADYNKLYHPANAETIVYQTPFGTTHDNHFHDPAYFSHVRVEGEGGNKAIMELQSDLMQHKEKVEQRNGQKISMNVMAIDEDALSMTPKERGYVNLIRRKTIDNDYMLNKGSDEFRNYLEEEAQGDKSLQNAIDMIMSHSESGKTKRQLMSYKNEARMRRTIDETVKNMAEDGVKTLKIPYGPTVAMIEGHSVHNVVHSIRSDSYETLKKDLIDSDEFVHDYFESDKGAEPVTLGEAREWIKKNIDGVMNNVGVRKRVDGQGADVVDPAKYEGSIKAYGLDQNKYIRMQTMLNKGFNVTDNKKIIEAMPIQEQQTVANFYENQLMPYVKKMYPGGKDVEYKGAWWHEIPIADRAGKPMKVFKRDDAVLYRAGGLEDKNKTGIFLSNDKSVADNYKDTGPGGKTTLAYKIDENANLYKGENRRQLIQELDPVYAKGRDEREYKWAKQYKGEGPTAEQKSQRETEKRIKMILQKKGYDGVEYNGKGNDQAGEYQIFDKKSLQPEGLKPKK